MVIEKQLTVEITLHFDTFKAHGRKGKAVDDDYCSHYHLSVEIKNKEFKNFVNDTIK